MNIFRRILDWISLDSPEKRAIRNAMKVRNLTGYTWRRAKKLIKNGTEMKIFTWGFEYVCYDEDFKYYKKCIKKIGVTKIMLNDWKPTEAEKSGNQWCVKE